MLKHPLKGIIPPIVTPLLEEDKLDTEGFERLIEHILAGGVHGIFVLGTTGEGPSLSSKLKYEVVEKACKQVAGRVPVLVGITDTSFVESVNLSNHAAKCGADALVLAPPYYFLPGQSELLEYLEHIAPQLPLPLFLYNIPSMTKMHIAPDTVRKAAEIDNIIGCKDSSCNMIFFHELLKEFHDKPEFSLLIGPEELLGEAVMFGGHGGVSGGANVAPRLYVDMYEAAVAGDIDKMRECQKKIFQLREIYWIGQYSSSIIKGIKCALSCMGICSDFMVEPFHRFRDLERKKVSEYLDTLDFIKK